MKWQQNNWQAFLTADGNKGAAVVGFQIADNFASPWVLSVECNSNRPQIYLYTAFYVVFRGETEATQVNIILDSDGEVRESGWTFFVAGEGTSEHFGATLPRAVFAVMEGTDVLTIEIPTSLDPYIIEFNVAGLSSQIENLSDVCQ